LLRSPLVDICTLASDIRRGGPISFEYQRLFVGQSMSRKTIVAIIGFSYIFMCIRSASARPAEVIVIRHAEKPAAGNELNQKGRERAAALVAYFLETPELLEFKTPVAIYSPLPSHGGSSIRSSQTVTPLARALQMRINLTFRKDQIAALAKEILTDPRYSGRMVLICWDHKMIPEIAKALGAESAPDKWHGEAFDRTWVIKYSADGSTSFENLPQRLMFGDSTK
jgi:hypothetical protein